MKRVAMKKLKEVLLRLDDGASYSAIQRQLCLSKGMISKINAQRRSLKLSREKISELREDELLLLFYPQSVKPPEPDWERYFEKLQASPKATYDLVYRTLYCPEQEARQAHALGYSSFCRQFNRWKLENGHLERSSNLTYIPGEQMQIDYAGDTLTWFDTETGKKHVAQIFLACLPASKIFFAYATPKQCRKDWIEGSVAALHYFGGAAQVLVMDNASPVVDIPDRYEAEFPQEINCLCEHYGMIPQACVIKKPKQKNRVEASVNDAERWILAELQLREELVTAKNIGELNQKILALCNQGNDRPFKNGSRVTRRQLFEQFEKPTLQPLPAKDFEVCEWRILTVDKAHCVRISSDGGHRYSVPSAYCHKKVTVRISQEFIECFDRQTGVSLGRHRRCWNLLGEKTHLLSEHLTESEQYVRKDGSFFIQEMIKGGASADLLNTVFEWDKQKYKGVCLPLRRACQGLFSLFKQAPSVKVFNACLQLAIKDDDCSYRFCKQALATVVENQYRAKKQIASRPKKFSANRNYKTPPHCNTRGNYS